MMLAAYGQPEQGSFTLFANKVKDKAQWNSNILRRAGGTAAEEETQAGRIPGVTSARTSLSREMRGF